jgi:hypothetical protein
MAIDLRGMIELGDITAVEFRCRCGAYVRIRTLDELNLLPGVLRPCGKCGAEWEFDADLLDFLPVIGSHAAKKRSYSVHLVGDIVCRREFEKEKAGDPKAI